MELLFILLIVAFLYGVGWVWQTVSDIIRDIRSVNWEGRVFGQVASRRSVQRRLGGKDLRALRNVYGEVAERKDARLHDRSIFESPKLSYVRGASRVLLSIYETREKPKRFFTQLSLTMPSGWEHRLELVPERPPGGKTGLRNVGDVKIGDVSFDDRYLIQGEDPAFAREFLDGETRETIDRLRSMERTDRIFFSLNSSRMLVRKDAILSSVSDLELFMRLGESVYDRAFLFWQRESGIEILDGAGEEAPDEAPAVCQVCGVELDPSRTVYCRGCRTPHHEDCWDYNGGCSTFACGEKRFVSRY